MERAPLGGRAWLARAGGLVAGLALLVGLGLGVLPALDTRLVALGERLWSGYAQELREDLPAPDCDPAASRAQAEACRDAPAPAANDVFGGDPFAEDPFAAAPAAGPACAAVRGLAERCVTRHEAWHGIQARLTPAVRAWRAVETRCAKGAAFPWWRQLLVALLLGAALTTTARGEHIALRTPRTRAEHAVSQAFQLLAHVLLVASAIADIGVQRASTAEVEDPVLPWLWAGGFATLALVNVWQLLRPLGFDPQARSSAARMIMVVPLFAAMVVPSGAWFLLGEGHPSGQAIYLHRFVQHPAIYVSVGLYVLAGMVLAGTRLARLGFAVLEPWRLRPTLLAWLVGSAAAIPTAFTGASGIFVLAAGREIFATLRRAGASRRLALAATAMSGSLGVVLRPCLLVVLIAVMNKQVTTGELFGRGLWVFALSASLYLVAMLVVGRGPGRPAPIREALGPSLRALRSLLPHALAVGAVLALVVFGLGARVSEHTAPWIVPLALLAVLAVDRRAAARAPASEEAPPLPVAALPSTTAGHVGALLMLMAASVGLGGVVERADLVTALGLHPASPVAAMALLTVLLVFVGMLMEPLGAVVLVSVSLAGIAYDAGIAPAHFWMVVLVAFELGYLTPPVALNQLLARQAVGPEAAVEDEPASGLGRHLHLLLPMAVMGATLLIVAFGPLILAR
ncbi:MAG: TRAP transporter large permease subunit [Pseudomonadota bacterium]